MFFMPHLTMKKVLQHRKLSSLHSWVLPAVVSFPPSLCCRYSVITCLSLHLNHSPHHIYNIYIWSQKVPCAFADGDKKKEKKSFETLSHFMSCHSRHFTSTLHLQSNNKSSSIAASWPFNLKNYSHSLKLTTKKTLNDSERIHVVIMLKWCPVTRMHGLKPHLCYTALSNGYMQ